MSTVLIRRCANYQKCLLLCVLVCLLFIMLSIVQRQMTTDSGVKFMLTNLNRQEKDEQHQHNNERAVWQVDIRNISNGNKLPDLPLIMGWNKDWGRPTVKFLLEEWNNMTHCPYPCAYSDDRALFSHASIVLFFPLDSFDGLPENRRPDQLFTFFSYEPPPFSANNEYKKLPPNFFNLTHTYRLDSDVPFLYDYLTPLDGKEGPDQIWSEEQVKQKIAQKKHLALWLVSNCNTSSKREHYVEALQKHMNVTVYGQCHGEKRWSCKGECQEEMFDSHFFYLAFENSVCHQYVTEKFWNMRRLIVPVVLSRSMFAGTGVPDDAYIAADDFDTPEQLASHLHMVANEPSKYMRLFDWTKKYKKVSNAPETSLISPLCNLCKFAHQQKRQYWEQQQQQHIVPDIVHFWETDGNCRDAYAEQLIHKGTNNNSQKEMLNIPLHRFNNVDDNVFPIFYWWKLNSEPILGRSHSSSTSMHTRNSCRLTDTEDRLRNFTAVYTLDVKKMLNRKFFVMFMMIFCGFQQLFLLFQYLWFQIKVVNL